MSNQNIFKNAAEILYKDEKKKKKEKELRNSLISELGDEIEPKHVLYSSNEELTKMKEEKNKKDNNSKVPLPGNNSDEELYFLKNNSEINKTNENDKKETPRNDIKEGEIEINGVKLKDKIPINDDTDDENNDENIENKKLNNSKANVNKKHEETEDTTPFKLHAEYKETKEDNEVKISNDNPDERKPKIQDEDFNKMMKHIYKTEGGFVDNKNDLGGRTNKGITQKTFNAYNKKMNRPLKDVKDITFDEADEIYYKEYYKASGADKIKDKNLAYLHYDSAINHGVGRAKQFLEKSEGDFDKYYALRKKYYDNRIVERPNQKVFYNGWVDRINRIKKMKENN